MKVVIELAGEPKGKGRPRFVRAAGRAYTPEPTRVYETNLRYAAQVAMAGRSPMIGPLVVFATATLPIPASWSKKRRAAALAGRERPIKKPDYENILKMCDAFNEIVWCDDAQVVDGRIVKLYGERPFLRVEVWHWGVPESQTELYLRRDQAAENTDDLDAGAGRHS